VRQHRWSKHRTWRKLHLEIDEKTGSIVAAALTTNNVGDSEVLPDLAVQIEEAINQTSADGAYDSFDNYDLLEKRGAKVRLPPRETAIIRQHGNCKSPHYSEMKIYVPFTKIGNAVWKNQSGYHWCSLAEQ